jgi:hypothetical protein
MTRKPGYDWSIFLACSFAILSWPHASFAAEPGVGPCDLPIDVRATLVADDVPEWSIAMIYNRDNKHNGSFSINKGKNRVMPGVTLVEISSLSVLLKTRSGLQRCAAKGHRFKAAPKVLTQETPRKAGRRFEPIKTEISDEAEAVLVQFTKLTHDKKAVGGKPGEDSPGMWSEYAAGMAGKKPGEGGHGFRLEKLKKDTLLYDMGLRSFDIVKTVNGKNFDDPSKAMDMLQGLSDESVMSVVVKRRGKSVKIDVQLD